MVNASTALLDDLNQMMPIRYCIAAAARKQSTQTHKHNVNKPQINSNAATQESNESKCTHKWDITEDQVIKTASLSDGRFFQTCVLCGKHGLSITNQ